MLFRSIYPTLDYIESASRLAGSNSLAELIEKVRWSFGELNAVDEQKITAWYKHDPEYAGQGGEPMRWAFMSWTPPAH